MTTDQLYAQLRVVNTNLALNQESVTVLAHQRRRIIHLLRQEGETLTAIARVLGITRQSAWRVGREEQ